MDPGHLIAIQVTVLYIILGPLVLLAIYVLFDTLANPKEPDGNRQDGAATVKDPALWTDEDISTQVSRF